MALLIKNAHIIDGTGKSGYAGDVLIDRNTIVSIKKNIKTSADAAIDAKHNFLVPGFIDGINHDDHYLNIFEKRGAAAHEGITTAIGGHAGVSLAPLLYGTLEPLRQWTRPHQSNIDWQTAKDFFETLGRNDLPTHFGTFVGLGTVSHAVTRGARRMPTARERETILLLLEEVLDAGGFGISQEFGNCFDTFHSEDEMDAIFKLLGAYKAYFSIQLQDERNLLENVRRIVDNANKTNVKTIISHLIAKDPETYARAIAYIEKESDPKLVRFAVAPDGGMSYPLYKLLPSWARNASRETMLGKIRNPQTREFLERELRDINPRNLLITHAHRNDALAGKTLADIMKTHNVSATKALLHLMEMTDLYATVFRRFRTFDSVRALESPNALVATHGNFGKDSFRPNPFAALFAGAQRRAVPLETMIAKVTQDPASFFNLKKCGAIKTGNRADLVLLDKNTFKPLQTFVGGASSRGIILKRT